MQSNTDVQKKSMDNDSSDSQSKKGPEQIVATSPEINRFVQDVRGRQSSGSRIDVQIDWAKGRMAVSY
jgi:hypothetical protein